MRIAEVWSVVALVVQLFRGGISMRKLVTLGSLMVAVLAGLFWAGGDVSQAQKGGKKNAPPFPKSIHLAMGNPTKAEADPDKKDNYLMEKDYFALSYNNSKGSPNWVSWHLSAEYLGTAPRKPRFATDNDLPAGFTKITHNDYVGSGFDRGHMCPHSDRALNKTLSFATFVMTNIVPQAHENNAGAWEALEIYSRYLAKSKAKDLFIVSGPVGEGGEGKNGPANKIAGGKVVVPAKVWKVILVVNRDEDPDPVKWVDEDCRSIAVMMPNDTLVDEDNWGQYRCSVEKVESETGFTFFDKAPANIINPLKKRVDKAKLPKLPHEH
jgi:endonuclease G